MEIQVKTCGSLQYILRYPKDFKETEKLPVLLYLHGSGTRGKALEAVLETDAYAITAQHADFPFLMVGPMCPAGATWFDFMADLKALVAEISSLPYADTGRFYGMGASMGGYGIWQLAMSIPETFAAIVPICGGGMYWAAKRLVDVPVWAFHGAEDKSVAVFHSDDMVARMKKHGLDVRYSRFDGVGHDV